MGRDDGFEDGYRFGSFHLRPGRRELLCDGQAVRLAQRPLNMLIVLVERRDRVVSKDEILDLAFPGVFVEPHIIAVYVSAMRKLLGPEVITTVPGIGYRFTAKLENRVAEIATAPAPAPARTATNLPAPVTAVIGRALELSELPGVLSQNRLVTLAGPGGIGKTRLAIEFGWRVAAQFPDGVWLIDLAPLTDPGLIASAAATVLAVVLNDEVKPVDVIAAAIAKKCLLLIFDNCEYLAAAAAEVITTLLHNAAGLSVLVTSQEILRLPEEAIYRLDPLALPLLEGNGAVREDDIVEYGAVELFVTRARSADRRFRLDSGNAASVAAICCGLEGIPLALEMAAARLPLLGIEGLRARLGARLKLFGGRTRSGEARHQTLLGMVEWSCGLLDEADRVVFRRLGIFRGTFSLEAAIALVGEKGAEPWDTADAIGRLIDKSLVVVEASMPPRYRLLETLRLYAADKILLEGENITVSHRHMIYFTQLFDRAYEVWEMTPDTDWLATYQPELDNARAALGWAMLEPARAETAISLAGSFSRILRKLGLFAEGRTNVNRAMSLINDGMKTATAARLLKQASNLWHNSDRLKSLNLGEQSADIYRQIGDRQSLGTALSANGILYTFLGRYDEARSTLREAEKILVGGNSKKSLFHVVNGLGVLSLFTDNFEEALLYNKAATKLANELSDKVRESQILLNLAEIEFAMGRVGRSIEYGRAAVTGLRPFGFRSFLEGALCNLASYLIVDKKPQEARIFAYEAINMAREEGGFILRVCLQQWALLAAIENKFVESAQIFGFIKTSAAKSSAIRERTEQKIYDQLLYILSAALPTIEFDRLMMQGATWTEAQAVDFTFEKLVSLGGQNSLI